MTQPSTIAHYRIISKLGEGGMGAVYRATDTKLFRDVAIKILPDTFASDPDRLARFTREAQVLASLNHPNIAAIYGVEERAIVMELVEGQTLAGPIPLDEALPLINQLIDALEYAHDKAVIHRDLKPANIKISPEGRLKVLDFGLAKALSSETSATDPSSSPTITMRATMSGMVMGTAAYMSPEQARGHNVDKRTDIWAFGVVVYEVLTGKSLFAAPTISDTLAAVLRQEPDFTPIPARCHRLLRLCLTRDPRLRLRDIADARPLLDETAIPAAPLPRRSPVPWTLAAVFLVAALVFGALWLRRPVEEGPPLRFSIPPPENATFFLTSNLVVSPDGRRIAFLADQGGTTRVWLRELNASESRPLPGTEGVATGGALFWSPDSRFLAFFASGKLKKVNVAGGPPVALCDAPRSFGGSWGMRDVIVFSTFGGALVRVPAAGGSPTPVTALDVAAAEVDHRWPWFLPDGRHFLFLARGPIPEKHAIWVGDLESRTRRRVITAGSNPAYDPRGLLLFAREGTLMAQPWNPDRAEADAEAFAIAEQVEFRPNVRSNFSISNTGVLAYFTGAASGIMRLTWFDHDGKPLGFLGPRGTYYKPAISPDGATVAVDRRDVQMGTSDIWLYDLVHGAESKFTFDPKDDLDPTWSPDGSRIVFASDRGAKWGVYLKSAAGNSREELLFDWPTRPLITDWSRDGRFLIFTSRGSQTNADIYVLPDPTGDPTRRKAYAFLQTSASEGQGVVSPDGKWLAYTSDESRESQIYVQSFPGKEAKFQISSDGGRWPLWSRDGKDLFYLADRKMMRVQMKGGARFEHTVPRPMFDTGILSSANADITPDGKRFLIPSAGTDTGTGLLNVVINWHAALKK